MEPSGLGHAGDGDTQLCLLDVVGTHFAFLFVYFSLNGMSLLQAGWSVLGISLGFCNLSEASHQA